MSAVLMSRDGLNGKVLARLDFCGNRVFFVDRGGNYRYSFNIGMANIENAGEKIMQARKTKA